MRADRLLSMIWLLRAHGGLSTAELAQQLEVSRRTILRDVDALAAAGVPVYCERGPRGGVRLLPGYRTAVTGLSEAECRAIFAALSPWAPASIGLGEAFSSGVRKLLAAIPDVHRGESLAMASRIVVDPRGWLPQPVAGQPGGAFAVVQKAVFARECLRLTYRSRQAATARELIVEPHGLVSASSDWYLCATDDERVRFLKMARIEEAAPLAEPCRGPEPDVAQAWHEHRDRFLQQFTPVTVVGWVRERRLQEAREWSIRAGTVEFSQDSPGDGWQPVSLEFMDGLHAVTALLRLGADARVEAPERIRVQLLDHVDQIRCQYQTS